MTELLLDERIMWWVFLPIVYVTFMLSVVRIYYGKYNMLQTTKKPIKQRGAYRDLEDRNTMAKCDLLVRKAAFIPKEAFDSRRTFLCSPDSGYLFRERQPTEMADPMAQMQGMMEGMSGSFPTIIISIGTLSWINYAFGGILLAKVPFNLSQQFKAITQSGVEMESLNVQYISGISFYFLIMFGLGQLFSLFLQENDEVLDQVEGKKGAAGPPKPNAGANPMMNPMGPMMPMNQAPDPNQQKSPKDLFKNQIESLSLVQHQFAFDKCPASAVRRLKAFLADE